MIKKIVVHTGKPIVNGIIPIVTKVPIALKSDPKLISWQLRIRRIHIGK